MPGRIKLLYGEDIIEDRKYGSRPGRKIIIEEWKKVYHPKWSYLALQVVPESYVKDGVDRSKKAKLIDYGKLRTNHRIVKPSTE